MGTIAPVFYRLLSSSLGHPKAGFSARIFPCSGVRASIVEIVSFDSGRNTLVCCMVFKEFNGAGGIYMSLILDKKPFRLF
jgi:hypothetical protein